MLVGICGAPSSGKSVLARAVVNKICLDGHSAEYVSEYARHYINKCNCQESLFLRTPLHQANISKGQMEWEDVVPSNVEFVISDSPIIAHVAYTYNLVDFTDLSHVEYYHQYYRDMLQRKSRYTCLFYLPPVLEFKSDGTRAENKERAARIGQQIKGFLMFHQIPFYEIQEVDLEKRVTFCIDKLLNT